MHQSRKAFFAGFFLALLLGAAALLAEPVFAQDQFFGGSSGQTQAGFAEAAGFGPVFDLRLTIARLIRTFLSFLGIIAVIFVLYGGFLWMTAAGSVERVAKAKKVLINAVIGLVIVLSSFTITSFIIGAITDATGAGTVVDDGGGGGGFTPPGGTPAAFAVDSINLECAAALQNLQLQMIFTKNVDASTVEAGGIRVMNNTAGGPDVDGVFITSGRKVTFTPNQDCPANPGEKCFNANSLHTIIMDPGILRSTSGTTLSGEDDFEFTTGEGVDLTGPTLTMTFPDIATVYQDGAPVLLQSQADDDTGVSNVDFFVDGDLVFEAGLTESTEGSLSPVNAFNTDSTQWDTIGYLTNESYSIRARGYDCSGRSDTTATINVTLRAVSCNDGDQNSEAPFLEEGVDCGGDSQSQFYCGACDGASCSDDSECASGVCSESGVCETVIYINGVSAGDGAPGNLITISGKGFGSSPPATGGVTFLGSGTEVGPYDCNGQLSWSDQEIVVQVPAGAADGGIQVTNAAGLFDTTSESPGPIIPDFVVNDTVRPGLCAFSQSSGEGGSTTTLIGTNFGAPQGDGTVYFRNFEAAAYNTWEDFGDSAETEIVVPQLNGGKYNTQLFTGSNNCSVTNTLQCNADSDCPVDEVCIMGRQGSNTLKYTVVSVDPTTTPVISFIDTGWKACTADAGSPVCGSDDDCQAGTTCDEQSSWGPPGQYVSIFGSNFGTTPGQVIFTREALETFGFGLDDFPPVCEDVPFWSNDQITVKVPSKHADSTTEDVEDGTDVSLNASYLLHVRRADGIESATTAFEMRSGLPGPALCAIQPSVAPVGTEISLLGENFGQTPATVRFRPEENVTTGFVIEENEVRNVLVPDAAVTGATRFLNTDGLQSNAVTFTVGDCREDADICGAGEQCCANGSCSVSCEDPDPVSHFSYLFSTGPIPFYPQVLVQCDVGGGSVTPSPSPWEGFTAPEAVCVDAVVSAVFNMDMAVSSFGTGFELRKCLTQECATDADREDTAVPGIIEQETLGVEKSNTLTFRPTGGLDPNGRYVATLFGGGTGSIQADDDNVPSSEFLQNDFEWYFTVSSDDTPCEVGAVSLEKPNNLITTDQSPDNEIGLTANLIAAGQGRECVLISCAGKQINWSSTMPNQVGLAAPGLSEGLCVNTAIGLEETQGAEQVLASVSSSPGNPTDNANVTVDFTDPDIVDFAPTASCQAACPNALVFAEFNTDMVPGTTESLFTIEQCTDGSNGMGTEFCSSSEPIDQSVTTYYDNLTRRVIIELDEPIADQWEAGRYYRVHADGAMTSTSLTPLSVIHGSDGFSWIFRVKTDGVTCGVDRVEVEPQNAIVKHVGARQEFNATPFGAPDECSLKGQALADGSIVWTPWNAIDTPDAPLGYTGTNPPEIATLLADGDIALSSDLPPGCTADCVSSGTTIGGADPICGNGVIEIWEDCDDGGTANGDGCSAICLREGGNTDTQTIPGLAGLCGDGIRQVRSPATQAGEDCDDGNTVSGDGCSDRCLNEGAQASGAVCGNGIVAQDPATGVGEECDDPSINRPFGCNQLCLNTGSTPINAIAAVCGANGIEAPAESCEGTLACDDGSACNSHDDCFSIGLGLCQPRSNDGDFCSSTCKAEGTNRCAFVCSASATNAGAECNPDAVNPCPGGSCPVPTNCCGNGVVEQGEECDADEGCSNRCLLLGSDPNYSTASFCGDGTVGIGEESACEDVGSSRAVGPYAVGEMSIGAVQELVAGQAVDDTIKVVTSEVTATADGVSGSANLSLSCACTTDLSCGDSDALGCGAANCCFERPTVGNASPVGNDACQNAAVWVEFDQAMQATTFGSPAEGVHPNLILNLVSYPNPSNPVQTISVDSDADCPEGLTYIAENASTNIFARAWQWLRSAVRFIFGIQSADAVVNSCAVPVTYFTQAGEDGGMRVYLRYSQPLIQGGTYEVVVVGDSNTTDANDEGVLSIGGVGINASEDQATIFTVGADFCTLDMVIAQDLGVAESLTDPLVPPSSGFITSPNDVHKITASGFSLRSAQPEEIQPMGGIYEWEWDFGTSIPVGEGDNAIETALTSANNVNPATADANAVDNGEEVVIASALITVDTINPVTTAGKIITGEEPMVALLCENPWPNPADVNPPFVDELTNFGFYYCRDAGDPESTADDLPAFNYPPTEVSSVPGTGIIKEYLFILPATGDAVGVRVFANDDYLPPDLWYAEQGFLGSAAAASLDGYEAVRDGNTIYSFAANQTGDIFPNMYVVSTTDTAGSQSINVFNQVLNYWNFNANTTAVSDLNICRDQATNLITDPVTGEFIGCEWNGDCRSIVMSNNSVVDFPGAFCDAEKKKLQRDTKRLSDIVRTSRSLREYAVQTGECSDGSSCIHDSQCQSGTCTPTVFKQGHCSETTNQACTTSADCVAGEECLADIPGITEGSFIRAMTTSRWPSWSAEFGNEAGVAFPVDPLNRFISCPFAQGVCSGASENPGAECAPGSEVTGCIGSQAQCLSTPDSTCYDAATSAFQCDEGSHIYGYRATANNYTLTAQLEHVEAPWVRPIDTNTDPDDVHNTAQLIAEYGGYSGPAVGGAGEAQGMYDNYAFYDAALGQAISGISATANCIGFCFGGFNDDEEAQALVIVENLNSLRNQLQSEMALSSINIGLVNQILDAAKADLETAHGFNGGFFYQIIYKPRIINAIDDGEALRGSLVVVQDLTGLADGFYAEPAFCNGVTIGDSVACGDGVKGPGEVCELGSDVFVDYCPSGQIELRCGCENDDGFNVNACPGGGGGICRFETQEETTNECVPFECGNGVVDDGELCDDGSLNGTYGHCSFDCNAAGTFFCGDGFLAGSEQCDCGTVQNFSSVKANGTSWAAVNDCQRANGIYSQTGTTCSFDCKLPGPSCGDGIVNGSEACDPGNPDTAFEGPYGGALCAGGPNANNACQTNSDCPNSFCGGGSRDACSAQPGTGQAQARTRSCNASCQWNTWSQCLPQGECGDGIKQGLEECDDGNDNNSDSCVECKLNICGDGHVYQGVESCDEGNNNGQSCENSAPYNGFCNYCTVSCTLATASGPFCGDGIINGNEFCDGLETKPWCYTNTSNGLERKNVCSPDHAGTTSPSVNGCDAEHPVCNYLGICDGGENHGALCRDDGNHVECRGSEPGEVSDDGICIPQDCRSSCAASCPFETVTAEVLVQSTVPGALPEESITLHRLGGGVQPDRANLLFPACTYSESLRGDVVGIPEAKDVYIVYVIDESGSMGWALDTGESRMVVAKEAVNNSIADLKSHWESSSAEINMAIVPYENTARENYHTFDDDQSVAALQQKINALIPGGGTETDDGIRAAISLLGDVEVGVEKIVILLTDGDPNGRMWDTISQVKDTNGGLIRGQWQFYSATIGEGELAGFTDHVSNAKCPQSDFASPQADSQFDERCEEAEGGVGYADDGIKYGYAATTAEGVGLMFQQIADSLKSVTFGLSAQDENGQPISAFGNIEAGTGRNLPLPPGICNGVAPVSLPISIGCLDDECEIELGNFKFKYCPVGP